MGELTEKWKNLPKLPSALGESALRHSGTVFSTVCSMAEKAEITHCNHYSCFTSRLRLLALSEERESIECTALTSCLERSWGWNLRWRPISRESEWEEGRERERQHTSTLTYKPSLPQSPKLFALIYHHMLPWDTIQTKSSCCQICTYSLPNVAHEKVNWNSF